MSGTMTTTRTTKAYKGPGVDYGYAAEIPSGTTLTIAGQSKGFYLAGGGPFAYRWVDERDVKTKGNISTSTGVPQKTSTTSNKSTTKSPSTKSGGGGSSYTGTTVVNDPITPAPSIVTTDTNTTITNQSTAETLQKATELANKIVSMVNNRDAALRDLANNSSMRLFGLPHQLIEHNDYRISSTSNLGRMFTETILLDAPIVYVKPGTSNFLPGMSNDERSAYVDALIALAEGVEEKTDIVAQLGEDIKKGDIKYFDFSQNYARYMSNVNLLCRICAEFIGIGDKQVPWVKTGSVTYKNYDWRAYTYNLDEEPQSIMSAIKQGVTESDTLLSMFSNSVDNIIAQDQFVKLYVDASTSFSEGANNSTTSSMINGLTDQLSDLGKELSFFSGITGVELDNLINSSVNGIDEITQKVSGKADGQLATFFRRLTSSASQLLSGSNILAPDIWSDSSYGKSYSFNLILTTPYGNPESWYLNICVPLMHVLGFSLAVQTSSNTYTTPMLVQVFAPGWFSCDLGMVDNINIDKAGSGDAWSSAGFPNEYRINISVKDLHANLALPDGFSITHFFNNTGLLNYLMVNCGVDITKTGLNDKLGVFANLFANTLGDLVTETVSNIKYEFVDTLKHVFSLYK